MKQHSGACERNRDPILAVLTRVFPSEGTALEIAAGTGMHSVWFAPRLPGLTWIPTDTSEAALASIEAWRAETVAPNLQPARRLDSREADWGIDAFDAALCCNMIHISPWASAVGLLQGVSRRLSPGGTFVTYGPYRFADRPFAPSNARFDASLQARDPSWGIRDVDALVDVASGVGLDLAEVVDMPANNHCLVWRPA